MPPFRDIGNRLKEHFDGAIKVLPSNDGRSFMAAGDPTIKPPGREDIVSFMNFRAHVYHTIK
jgi:wingless-type MMTV integration site family, member 6